MYYKYLLVIVSLLIFTATPLRAEEITLKHNGRSLLAYVELAAGKKISDGIILMTHGALAHGQMEIMATLQQLMKDNGQNSIAITLSLDEDLRKGMYDCGKNHIHKHSDAIKEIGLWVQWLKSQGAMSISLLGHSRGGNQTAWFAAENSDTAIKKVILIAPDYWNYAKKKTANPLLDAVLKKANAMIKADKGDTLMKNTDFIFCKGATVRAATFADYYNENPNHYTPDLIKKIKVPVLVIDGSEDNLVPNIPGLYTPKLKSGDRLEVVKGADHFFRDLHADDVSTMILKFLN